MSAEVRDGVFISYRRSDAGGDATAVRLALSADLDPSCLFQDVIGIEPGAPFPDELRRQLERARVVVAVIGPDWLTASFPNGRRRIDDPQDWVNVELSSVLSEPGVQVIPLLVRGAPMLVSADLPPELDELSKRNAIRANLDNFDQAMQRLIAVIGDLLPGALRQTKSYQDTKEEAFDETAEALVAGWTARFSPPKPPPYFGGREDELDAVVDKLRRTDSIVVLFGLPGVGKSSLAAAAAHHAVKEQTLEVTWISGDFQARDILTELICIAFGVPYRSMSPGNSAAFVRAATEGKDRLLVLDGFNDDDLIELALSMVGGRNRILISTTVSRPRSASRRNATQIEIEPLDLNRSVELADRIYGDSTRIPVAWLEQVAQAAEGMPLALELMTEELRAIAETTPTALVRRTLAEVLEGTADDASLRILEKVVNDFDQPERSAFSSLGVLSQGVVPYELVIQLSSNYVRSPTEFVTKLRRMLLIGRPDSVNMLRIHSVTLGMARALLHDAQHAEERDARLFYQRILADILSSYGGYEWNVANYDGLAPYEFEVLSWLDSLHRDLQADRSISRWRNLAWPTFQFSWYLHWRGLFDIRRKYCARVVEMSPGEETLQPGDRSMIGNLAVDLGWTLLRGGDVNSAEEYARTGQAILRDKVDEFFADELLAQCALLRGEVDRSIAMFQATIDGLPLGNRPWFVFSMRLYLAMADSGAGQSMELLRQLGGVAEQVGLSTDSSTKDVAACLKYHQALAMLAAGDESGAVSLASESVDLFTSSGKRSASRVYAMALLARSRLISESAKAEYRRESEILAQGIRIASPYSDNTSDVWLDLVG